MLSKRRFDMGLLVFRQFLPHRMVLVQKFHSRIEVVSTHPGARVCLVFNMFDGVTNDPSRPLEVLVPETVPKAQCVTEPSRVEVMWRQTIFIHTIQVYSI